MNDLIDLVFNNIDAIVESALGILSAIGGCSVLSSFLPKIVIDASKVTQKISLARQVVKVLYQAYNGIVSAINVGGFNFGKSKNKF